MASQDDKTTTDVDIEVLAGVPEGTVLSSGETVVASTDEDGNVIGWHKEAE